MFEQSFAGALPGDSPGDVPGDLPSPLPGDLIAAARERAVAVRRAESDVMAIAYEWAVAHPARDDGYDVAVFHVFDGLEPLAGPGVPEVAEFCVAELGAALGVSTEAAKRLMGHALELAHRLPRLWRRVQASQVPVWRAREGAGATIHAHPALSPVAVDWVDAQVAPFVGKVSRGQIDRLVAQAIKLHGLATEPEPDPDDPYFDVHQDRRYVRLDPEVLAFDGTMLVEARVNIPDGLDLAAALSAGAAGLKALGSQASLDVRRSVALGEMARTQTALDLAGGDRERVTRTKARRVDLHLHFSAVTEPDESTSIAGAGFLENGQRLVLLDQVRRWVGASHTEVRVLPVIDLNAPVESDGYVPSPRLRRQVHLRDGTCVFPWCGRLSRRGDVDHVVPFDHQAAAGGRPQPGPTVTDNLASLCRSHHRLKTHTAWRLSSPSSGVFVWTSPHGQRFRRDRGGTTDLTDRLTDRLTDDLTGPPPAISSSG